MSKMIRIKAECHGQPCRRKSRKIEDLRYIVIQQNEVFHWRCEPFTELERKDMEDFLPANIARKIVISRRIIKGIEKCKTLEGMLGLDKKDVAEILKQFYDYYPEIQKTKKIEEIIKSLLAFLIPKEDRETEQEKGLAATKTGGGRLADHPVLLALLRPELEICMTQALLFRVLSKHVGLDSIKNRTKCRILLMPKHAGIIQYSGSKKSLIDPTAGVCGKELREDLELKEKYAEAFSVEDKFVVHWLKASYAQAPATAIKHYDVFHKKYPKHAECLNNRGILHRKLGNFDAAMKDYDKALSIKPDDPECLNNRGVLHKKLGNFDDAMKDYDKALSIRPDDPECLYNRGLTHVKLNNYDNALQDLKDALKLFKEQGQDEYAKRAKEKIRLMKLLF